MAGRKPREDSAVSQAHQADCRSDYCNAPRARLTQPTATNSRLSRPPIPTPLITPPALAHAAKPTEKQCWNHENGAALTSAASGVPHVRPAACLKLAPGGVAQSAEPLR
jgi:hypothetical protein